MSRKDERLLRRLIREELGFIDPFRNVYDG